MWSTTTTWYVNYLICIYVVCIYIYVSFFSRCKTPTSFGWTLDRSNLCQIRSQGRNIGRSIRSFWNQGDNGRDSTKNHTLTTQVSRSPPKKRFQPLWKICSSNGIISPGRGENKKYLKPPASKMTCFVKLSLNSWEQHKHTRAMTWNEV